MGNEKQKKDQGQQRHDLTYEASYNEGILYKDLSEADAKAYAQEMTDEYAPAQYDVDWADALFKKHGSNQNYEFSAQGGNEQTSFFASLNYKKEEGIAQDSSMDGFTGRVNVLHKSVDNKLQIGANISLSKQKSSVISEGFSYANPYFMVNWLCNPNTPIYNEDGSYYLGTQFKDEGFVNNPVQDMGLDKNTSDVFRSSNSLWASYAIIEGLTIKEIINYDYINNVSGTYWPITSNNGIANDGVGIRYPYQINGIYSSTTLNYNKTFKEKHNLDVLVGWDVDDKKYEGIRAAAGGYPNDKLPELANASTPLEALSYINQDHLLSFLSRINYDYDAKYYLSANFRRDGSSRLGANNRWANFWSASLAWRITQEDFMKPLTQINDFKLRMSYGLNGTLPKEYYSSLSLYGYGYNYQNLPGSAPTSVPNPDLSWEKNKNFNIGFDARFFDRINLTFDYYNRKTSDLLQDVPTSEVVGFKTVLKNVGAMVNKGIEFDINVDVFRNTPIKWNTGLSISHNKNEIVELYDGQDILVENNTRLLREGESYYSWWSRQWAGVDPQTGEEQWVLNTKNEDGTLNKELTKDPSKAQRVNVGNPDPKVTGGWRNSVSWKGIELNMLFSYSLGGKVWDSVRSTYTDTDGGNIVFNSSEDQLKRWQKPGDITDVPRRINNYKYYNYGSDRHVYGLSYLRLKNLSLSYTLPARWLTTARLSNARVFIAGSNLLTWTSYKNIDPEQPIDGIATFAFPNMKSVTFGIEIGL